MSEDQLQSTCYQYFHNQYPNLRGLLWAVPNGGSRNKIEAMKLKATGVISGVYDLHFFHKKTLHLFELKVGSNKLSENQTNWGLQLCAHGAEIYEIRDFETFKNIIDVIIRTT